MGEVYENMCVPVLLQCFRQSRAVVGVDAYTAHLHILQASRKVTHTHCYCSCACVHTHVFDANRSDYLITGI